MNSQSFKDVLRQIVEQNGASYIATKSFLSTVADLAPDMAQDRKYLKIAYDEMVVARLYKDIIIDRSTNYSMIQSQCVSLLTENAGMREDLAVNTVNDICYALGVDVPFVPAKKAEPVNPPVPQPNPATEIMHPEIVKKDTQNKDVKPAVKKKKGPFRIILRLLAACAVIIALLYFISNRSKPADTKNTSSVSSSERTDVESSVSVSTETSDSSTEVSETQPAVSSTESEVSESTETASVSVSEEEPAPEPEAKIINLSSLEPDSCDHVLTNGSSGYEKSNYGKIFAKNMYPNSSWCDVTYYLGGKYSEFTGTIYVNSHGAKVSSDYSRWNSATIYVYGDDSLLYEISGFNPHFEEVDFSIDVSSVNKLKIEFADVYYISTLDYGMVSIGKPKLVENINGSVQELKGPYVLTNMEPFSHDDTGYNYDYFSEDNYGNAHMHNLYCNGYEVGYSEYYLGSQYSSFEYTIFVADGAKDISEDSDYWKDAYIQIYADDELIATNSGFSPKMKPLECSVDIPAGTEFLKIVFCNATYISIGSDYPLVQIGEPYLYK